MYSTAQTHIHHPYMNEVEDIKIIIIEASKIDRNTQINKNNNTMNNPLMENDDDYDNNERENNDIMKNGNKKKNRLLK